MAMLTECWGEIAESPFPWFVSLYVRSLVLNYIYVCRIHSVRFPSGELSSTVVFGTGWNHET